MHFPAVGRGLVVLSVLAGCGLGAYYSPTPEELEEFEKAGPIEPELDVDRLVDWVPDPGPYRVVAGDLLEIKGPGLLFGLSPGMSTGVEGSHLARVTTSGKVLLPIGIECDAAGLTLAEVEQRIADELSPAYLRQRPSIVASVSEYHLRKVAVMGAVEDPGVIELRSDQMSLFGALTVAGGIVRATTLESAGARLIRIRRPGEAREVALAMPVKGLNIPFEDIPLEGGETIEVERWQPRLFTVVGLVRESGAFEYPPEQSYNLMQALAIAGGVDPVAAPPYASILRKTQAGEVIGVTYSIAGNEIANSSNVLIKPGDVIVVDHTIGSWTRAFIAEIFRVQLNLFLDPIRSD